MSQTSSQVSHLKQSILYFYHLHQDHPCSVSDTFRKVSEDFRLWRFVFRQAQMLVAHRVLKNCLINLTFGKQLLISNWTENRERNLYLLRFEICESWRFNSAHNICAPKTSIFRVSPLMRSSYILLKDWGQLR